MLDQKKLQASINAFTIEKEELQEIAAAFRYDIETGLGRREGTSSLRMLRSYAALPTGKEQGEFLALDFGGTNVRVLRIRLLGGGRYEILRRVAKPLAVPGVYDFAGKDARAEDMFDFLAGLIDEAIEGERNRQYRLGHTFSFPSEQTQLADAKLIIWTKEFAAAGVEGHEVNALLKQALLRSGIANVEPAAVINDTVAVLLAAAYHEPDTYIGSIYATGHNTCYYEAFAQESLPGMILNMESGGFAKLPPNLYDQSLDALSEKPGEQRLEKMVSGRYLGELFGLALQDVLGLPQFYSFSAIDLSAILADAADDRSAVRQCLQRHIGTELTAAEAESVQQLAQAVVCRSARLVAATYCGVLWHLTGPARLRRQHIAVDGSVYEKLPLIPENVRRAFYEILGEDAAQIDIVPENGGSGLGAAVAAAMAENAVQ